MHRNSLRERYEKKRKERQDILGNGGLSEATEDKKSLTFVEGEDFEFRSSFLQFFRSSVGLKGLQGVLNAAQ
jgi:hypothetical protein